MNNRVVRPMNRGDLEPVVHLESLSQPSPWTYEQFARELELPHSRLTLVESGDACLGYLCAWQVADELEIQNVVTAPEARRQGVAALLVEELLVYARGESVPRILLEVRRGNAAAIALYHRYGFEVRGERSGYYADGEDALLMTLELTESH